MKIIPKPIWLILGFGSTALGILGLFIPMFPGIVFLLLATFFFSKGSQRWHNWLLTHPTLGPPIVAWKQNGSISKKYRYTVYTMLFISIFLNILLDLPIWILVLHICITAGIVVFISTRPTH